MATLDERYLDGPNVGYCSSSDEDEPQGGSSGPPAGPTSSADPRTGCQTGPKGVLADYRDARLLARLEKAKQEQKMLKEAERFSTNAAAAEDEDEDELAQIRRRRLEHLRNVNRSRITEIPNKDVFLSTIEDTRQGHEAVIHIYRDDMEATQTLNEALLDLASQTRNVRFFKNEQALPTLQVYRNDKLIGNFVRVTDTLSEDFDVADVKKLLAENGIEFPSAR